DTEEEIVAKAKEGKLLVVPGNMIKQTIKLISPDEDEDDDIDVWVPYSAQDIEAEYQDNLFFFFAIDKKGNTYFSYSDFSKWCDGIWKDGLSDDKFKQAVIVDFQDEIDSYSEFKNSVQTGGATSRAADDPIKELEKALSGITYRYKIYHANYNYPAYKLFLSSVSTADKELLAKYEWTYIKNDSGKIADLVKGKSGDYNYGKLNVSTRTIRLWCIHNTKDHTHMYLIKDQPDMNFSNTYIGTGDGNSAIEQIISNTGGDWSYYGGSWSGYTVAKGKEWYGDSAWIQTRVVRKDGSPLSGSIAFSNTSPATTTVTHKISKGFSIHLDAGIGVEIGKESKIKPELKGGFSFSDSVSYDVPEVSVFYKSDPTYVRWEYNIRDDWDCSFSPFRYAGSKVKSQPSNTSVSNLRPNESIYMITVVDSVVKNAGLELKCGSKLKRKAFKAGVSCCIGYTSAEATAYADLPYDKDPSNYEGGKFPWEE
ncbi:MAG: hypothetical protein MJ052_05825, partial [Sphaerochaetaceae bacterium]|nr:hypothetical protein [Sphaerochaetaceae bacterium]